MQSGWAEFRFVLTRGEDDEPLRVFIEPWADEFTVAAGSSVTVVLVGQPPEGSPQAIFEWHEWGLLVCAEVGMVDRSITSADGTVIAERSEELARLLTVAQQVTFGYPSAAGDGAGDQAGSGGNSK